MNDGFFPCRAFGKLFSRLRILLPPLCLLTIIFWSLFKAKLKYHWFPEFFTLSRSPCVYNIFFKTRKHTFTEHLPQANKHYSKLFVCINSFSFHHSQMKYRMMSCPFHRLCNWSLEITQLAKITQLGKRWVRILQIQAVWLQISILLH